MLDGKSTVFWQTNPTQPMEIKYWKDSLKHGDWIWFYEDGKIRQKTHYIENKLNGEFLVFFSDGTQHIKGAYKNDLRDGLWEYFNEDGTVREGRKKWQNSNRYLRLRQKRIERAVIRNGALSFSCEPHRKSKRLFGSRCRCLPVRRKAVQ